MAATEQDSTDTSPKSDGISFGAKAFVFLIFSALGVSFIATTAVFINEFWDNGQWFTLGVYYSHLFVFFPTFGLIALYAFYLPSIVFVDLYWKYIRLGRVRFLAGTLVMAVLSMMISQKLIEGELPAIWELTPATLQSDVGILENCTKDCDRFSINQAITQVKEVSSKRVGLSKFIRQCSYDKLLPEPEKRKQIKYCFANGKMLDADACCTSQKSLGKSLISLKQTSTLSRTGYVHRVLLPLKVFFLIILFVIGAMLVFWSWKGALKRHYARHLINLEKGILSGVIAMLFWPMTNHAFLQSAKVLFGANYTDDSFFARSAPVFSLLFGLWAVLIVLFFMQHREQRQVELFFKAIGVVASGFAMLKYDLMIDYFVRFFGSGVDWIAMYIISFVLLLVLLPLLLRKKPKDSKSIFLEGDS